MDLELSGKRALVTGGSRGIGKQVARQLALEGAEVAIAARDKARLDATAAELATESGQNVVAVTVEVTDDTSVRRMGDAVAAALGGIDILVNAAARPAGHGPPPPRFDEVTSEAFFEEINTKVLGYLRCAQVAVPYMIARGWGRIVNISGLAARQTGSVIGSVRNAAVVALTKNLADELAPHGINVTVVHPGATRTEATPAGTGPAPAGNLVGRMIDAQEVAYVVAFLCSPKSVALTGDTVVAGGGVPRAIYY
jgi:NAD(P)-dependent dehydrogenase (short-subunit alcohol dehydrogenase family)